MNILQSLVNKYKDSKQKSINKKEFKRLLLQAVNDGRFTKDEVDELDKKKKELGFTEEDIKEIKAEIFTAAFVAAKSDEQVTKEEEQELLNIQKYLNLTMDEIQPATMKELARLRILNEIQKGNMPIMTVQHLIMMKDEKAYWSEPAILAEEKVLRRRFGGGMQGVSFRIMKGVSYRIGGFSGQSVSETGLVAVSNGDLIITSKRIVFRGDKKSFVVKLGKIFETQLFTNGLQFSEINRSKPRLIKFAQIGNHNIIGAVLSYAINHYIEKE